jgi:hypothetical protein
VNGWACCGAVLLAVFALIYAVGIPWVSVTHGMPTPTTKEGRGPMGTEIWNTYEMALAATTGGLIAGVAAVAVMVLKRLDGSREAATAKGWWEKAIAVQEHNDRARWAPEYSPNLFVDRDVTGEVVAEQVHEPLALSDRPAADEDEVGDEQPVEPVSGAPASLWSRLGGWWREQRSRIRVLCQVRRVVNPPYRGRHWVSDVQHTGAWPLVVPKQRDGGDN